MQTILVLNSGSSSLKYEIFEMPQSTVLAAGIVERIGEPTGVQRHVVRPASGQPREGQPREGQSREGQSREERDERHIADHDEALDWILDRVTGTLDLRLSDLAGIGHRVVHGGERFVESTFIDARVVETIRELIPLAPLHNPPNLSGIEVALRRCPDVPQVAVFDTAFHHTMPPHAFRYAVPRDVYEQYGVRRYGFHGTSHSYVARQAARFLDQAPESLNLITVHLGNGASAAAVRGGRCVDTSMGLTPLEGLMMGTRSGDIDPALIFHLAREAGWPNEKIETLLNRESGLKGVAGVNDMRDVLQRAERGDEAARLAVDMYAYRIRKYLGAYLAVLGRTDAVVFTAGIGENSPDIRAAACQGLEALGIAIDDAANRRESSDARSIHTSHSRTAVLVVPTDEEREIAEETYRLISEGGGSNT